jgi:hypothetical protein
METQIKTMHSVEISKEDMEALIRIRNYFGENDKTQLEHMAFDVLNRVVKPFINLPTP